MKTTIPTRGEHPPPILLSRSATTPTALPRPTEIPISPSAPRPTPPEIHFGTTPITRLAMADCRSLMEIEFLRAFEHHRHRASSSKPASSSSPRSRRASSSSRSRGGLFTSLCDHSTLAAVDALVLLASLEVREAMALHPAASCVPLAAGMAAGAAVLAWDAAAHRARRCGRPRCRGLRKAVEFDIQPETEGCVHRLLPPGGAGAAAARPVELGDAHRELEAELGDGHRELEAVLRKMAPPNGRTVLIFRAPCGCPKGRMEVRGAKKVRRIKK